MRTDAATAPTRVRSCSERGVRKSENEAWVWVRLASTVTPIRCWKLDAGNTEGLRRLPFAARTEESALESGPSWSERRRTVQLAAGPHSRCPTDHRCDGCQGDCRDRHAPRHHHGILLEVVDSGSQRGDPTPTACLFADTSARASQRRAASRRQRRCPQDAGSRLHVSEGTCFFLPRCAFLAKTR